MLLNPFLTVNHKQSTYYFSEKYAQKQKPFLTLETTKGLDELVKNNQLNQKISQHLQYSFAISDMWTKPVFFSGSSTNAPNLAIPVTCPSTMLPTSKAMRKNISSLKINNLYHYTKLHEYSQITEFKIICPCLTAHRELPKALPVPVHVWPYPL